MQVLFKDIVSDDIGKVRERLEKDPDSANLVATAPPKQFAGMSPLQVCYHKGTYEIAALLLEHGADPELLRPQPLRQLRNARASHRDRCRGRELTLDTTNRASLSRTRRVGTDEHG